MSGGTCVDVDECAVLNGNCDFHVACTNLVGSVKCDSCPLGFLGNGSIPGGCIAQCGNGRCELALGENCVSCPFDCNNKTCNVCGDSYCQTDIESCHTCPEDCGLCSVTHCIPQDCSNHGTCNAGTCVCDSPWGGPGCDKENTNINLNFTSGGGLEVSTDTPGIAFLLSISSVVELDSSNETVSGFNITNQNYTFTSYSNTQTTNTPKNGTCNDCDLTYYVQVPRGNTMIYKYNLTLENNAYLEMMIWQFSDTTTTVTFANTSSEYQAQSFKLAVQLRNWPFKNLHNSLAIIMNTGSNEEKQCSAVKSNEDETKNLKWYTINIKGVTLYGQFLNRAIVDGLFRTVSFHLNSDNSVTATFPHFWENLVMDPSFSVLLGAEDSSCHKKSNKKLLIEIIVPIVSVFVIALLVALLYPKIKSRIKVSKEKHRLDSSESGVEIKNVKKGKNRL